MCGIDKQAEVADNRDEASNKSVHITVVVLCSITAIIMIWLAPWKIIGNEFGVAWWTFVTVTLVYYASSVISKLTLIHKLRKYDIDHPQLSQKITFGTVSRVLVTSLIVGGLAGIASYLSWKTVEHSDFNYAWMIVVIGMVPVVSIILSWVDSR